MLSCFYVNNCGLSKEVKNMMDLKTKSGINGEDLTNCNFTEMFQCGAVKQNACSPWILTRMVECLKYLSIKEKMCL